MGSLNFEFVAIFVLFPVVAARGIRDGSTLDSKFDALPLAVANLVVYGLLLLATLIQIPIAARAILRASVRLPAAGTTIALTIATIGYALGIATIFAKYQNEGYIMFFNLRIASTVFIDLKDAAIFVLIALVLHNRYRSTRPSSRGLIYFTCIACLLFLMMAVLLIVDMRVYAAASVEQLHSGTTLDAWSRFRIPNDIFCTLIVFQVLGILFLSVSSFLVWTRTKKDVITSLTLFAIIPTLLLHGIAQIIFVITTVRLPLLSLYTSDARLAFDFASTTVYGVLDLVVTTLLVVFLARPRMWRVLPLFATTPPPPQFVCPLYVTVTPPPRVVYPHISMHDLPPTKFDDQGDSQPLQSPYSFHHPYAYAQ